MLDTGSSQLLGWVLWTRLVLVAGAYAYGSVCVCVHSAIGIGWRLQRNNAQVWGMLFGDLGNWLFAPDEP